MRGGEGVMKVKKIVVGYARVSTSNQKEEGTIEIQQNALREYSKPKGYKLEEIFSDDGISGGLEDRPGLVALFDYLECNKNVDAVLIFKLDRLARDLYIQEHLIRKLEKHKVKIVSLKEPKLDSNDPVRKAFRQFMGIVSELEKAFITMRLSGGRLNKAKKGRYAGGGLPYGYKSL
jgi:site-specific DNA recombinase